MDMMYKDKDVNRGGEVSKEEKIEKIEGIGNIIAKRGRR